MQSMQLNNVNKKYIFVSVFCLIIFIELLTSNYFRYYWFYYVEDAKTQIGDLSIQLDEGWYPEFTVDRKKDTEFLILDTISFRNIKDVDGARTIDIDLISHDVARNLDNEEDVIIKVRYGEVVLKKKWLGVAGDNYLMFFSEKFKLLITVNNERDIYQVRSIWEQEKSSQYPSNR